jgi:RNA polymerase sigma factor (sigma-70 family)
MLPGGQDGQSGLEPVDADVIDLRLATLAAAGDTEAFAELYRRHAPLARRVAWSVLRDDRDADDVVADAFERLLRVLPAERLHDRRAFRAYLLVTTKNLALNAARQRTRRRLGADDGAEEPDLGASALDQVVHDEETSLMRRAFAVLPERWRSVLWLTEVEGLPHRAAAELLGVSANGVSQLAARARSGLRESFLQTNSEGSAAHGCRFTRERLAAHAGGALATAEAAEVEHHLAECDVCSDRFAEVADLAGTLRHAALPVGLIVGLGGIGGARALHPFRISWRAARAAGLAVAAVTVVVVGLTLRHDNPRPPPAVRAPVVLPNRAPPTTLTVGVLTTTSITMTTSTVPASTTVAPATSPPPTSRPAVTTHRDADPHDDGDDRDDDDRDDTNGDDGGERSPDARERGRK